MERIDELADTLNRHLQRHRDAANAVNDARAIGDGVSATVGHLGQLPAADKRRQLGGLIPGVGSGDIVPAMLEPGEYMIRRSSRRRSASPA